MTPLLCPQDIKEPRPEVVGLFMPGGHNAASAGADDLAQPSAPSGALRMRYTPCGCCPPAAPKARDASACLYRLVGADAPVRPPRRRRGMPPAAPSFLSQEKRWWRKECQGTRNSACAQKNKSFRCALFHYSVRSPNALTGDRRIGFPDRTANFTSRHVNAR